MRFHCDAQSTCVCVLGGDSSAVSSWRGNRLSSCLCRFWLLGAGILGAGGWCVMGWCGYEGYGVAFLVLVLLCVEDGMGVC